MRRERRIKRKRRQKKRREIKQTKIPRRMEKVREIRLVHLLERITAYNHQMYRKKELRIHGLSEHHLIPLLVNN